MSEGRYRIKSVKRPDGTFNGALFMAHVTGRTEKEVRMLWETVRHGAYTRRYPLKKSVEVAIEILNNRHPRNAN